MRGLLMYPYEFEHPEYLYHDSILMDYIKNRNTTLSEIFYILSNDTIIFLTMKRNTAWISGIKKEWIITDRLPETYMNYIKNNKRNCEYPIENLIEEMSYIPASLMY